METLCHWIRIAILSCFGIHIICAHARIILQNVILDTWQLLSEFYFNEIQLFRYNIHVVCICFESFQHLYFSRFLALSPFLYICDICASQQRTLNSLTTMEIIWTTHFEFAIDITWSSISSQQWAMSIVTRISPFKLSKIVFPDLECKP